jgi:hypothetical protein
MYLKMNLISLSLLVGLVMNSNKEVNAQKGSAEIFQTDASGEFLKGPAQGFNQGDHCSGLTINQISDKSRLETRNKKSEFIAMNKKYYRKDAEINKASPVVVNSSFSYYTPPKDSTIRLGTKDFFLRRSKNQKTAAWILLGAGTSLIPLSYIVAQDNLDVAGVLILSGVVIDLTSIPFFISASHNKKKAASLSFGNQTIYSPLDKSYCRNAVPSLTLRIKL